MAIQSEQNYTLKSFAHIFEEITNTVVFQHNWKNGTGYLDSSAYEIFENLENGDRFRFVDDAGRRAIGIVVRKGHNLVIYERYAPKEDERCRIHVSNTTKALHVVLSWKSGAVDIADIMIYLSKYPSLNAFGKYNDVARAIASIDGDR